MHTEAVLLTEPKALHVADVALSDPGPGDLVVEITHSGISTGTEKLLWSGEMPPFPGLGYPLVPGYEATGTVVEAGPDTALRPGQTVFVPGSSSYIGAHGIFGAAARTIVTDASRAAAIDPALGASGALLALAATARHAITGGIVPDLVVGHGTLGRLVVRQCLASGYPAPTVWETNPDRRAGDHGYAVIDPETDDRRDYISILDASGDAGLLNTLIGRLAKGGEVILAGFYAQPVSFAYPPAFMREARLRIAAEWNRADLDATRALIDAGRLSLDDLITHTRPAHAAPEAYKTAFEDPACLKMILDWT